MRDTMVVSDTIIQFDRYDPHRRGPKPWAAPVDPVIERLREIETRVSRERRLLDALTLVAASRPGTGLSS